jgi:hypothetical protein
MRGTDTWALTYLNRALSSVNPEASANTAERVPMFRSANIARYLWKRGTDESVKIDRRDLMLSSDISAGAGAPDNKPEAGGAGSIEVYTLTIDGN